MGGTGPEVKSKTKPKPSLELVPRVLAGEVPAVARLISRAEALAPECREALDEIFRHAGGAHIVGITGVPGSGKSTLVRELVKTVRRSGRRVAVIAIDPTSPFSGGSILGDRIRMNEVAGDPGVYIRSMATRGSLGGLAAATLDAVDIVDAAGFDLVLIETVGVGQDEIEVVQAAHTTVVVSAPGLGDDIQAIKAGVLEIADLHVVSKCDRSDAERTITELKHMLMMGLGAEAWQVPVLPTSAERGEGVGELVAAIDRHFGHLKSTGELQTRRERIARYRMLKAAEARLRSEFANRQDGAVGALTGKLLRLELSPHAAADELLASFRRE